MITESRWQCDVIVIKLQHSDFGIIKVTQSDNSVIIYYVHLVLKLLMAQIVQPLFSLINDFDFPCGLMFSSAMNQRVCFEGR